MIKVFFLIPETGYGPFFFSLSLLGWALQNKTQTPNNTVKPKAPEQVLPTC